MKPEEIDNLLLALLKNGESYSLESLSSQLEIEKADVHQSFMRLSRLNGWSIRPYNRLPYWRSYFSAKSFIKKIFVRDYPRENRGRAKGEKYNHDYTEPDWLRTMYKVRRPEM